MKKRNLTALVLTFVILLTFCFSGVVSVEASAGKNWAGAYLEIIKEKDKEDPNSQVTDPTDWQHRPYTYSLIYFNNDSIPELVVGLDGYWVSMYTYDKNENKAYEVIDAWPYGARGNVGYEYLPKKNFMRNYNSDYGGVFIHAYCMKMKNHEIVDRYPKGLMVVNYNDANGNGEFEWGEEIGGHPVYCYGNKKISAKKYNSYTKKSGKFKQIKGTKTFQQMKEKLLAKGANDTAAFQAVILEIYDNYYLVEPVEGSAERSSADRITVPMTSMNLSTEVGDILEIVYDGAIAESYPAQIPNVYSIRVVEKRGSGN